MRQIPPMRSLLGPACGLALLGAAALSPALGAQGTVANAPVASGWSALTTAQRAALDSGRAVVIAEELPASPWPQLTVWRLIAATPEEAAAVFGDYERHVRFVPGLKKSTVSRVIDRATVEVDYVHRVPIVRDEAYTVRDHVSRSGAGAAATYRVTWSLVRATSTKAAEGEARFEPHPRGTLLVYRNLVTPGSAMAGLGIIKRRARKEVEETVEAIAHEVERTKAGDAALLGRQLERLRAMLSP